MSKSRVLYTKPSIGKLEVQLASDAVENGWGEQCYAYISQFEKQFADFCKTKYAIATSSCTGAMHMGLAALGVGPGDEVILADTNWIATVAPVVHLGATPVFVDILADSWCLDPKKTELAITEKTKAIICTHLYGNLCDMNAIRNISVRYDVPIIEDAAEAIGSVYQGNPAGSMGAFGSFSFHGTKTMTTGEGGMLVTNDDRLYETVTTLSNHGRSKSQPKQFWPDMIGFKYKISNVQAAIGCAQMQRIDALIDRKREILSYYKERFNSVSGLSMNTEPEGTRNGAWMPTLVCDPEVHITREDLLAAFSAANIDARVFFWPLSALDMFDNVPENKNAYSIPSRAVNLPSYHDMTEQDLERVVDVVRSLLSERRTTGH